MSGVKCSTWNIITAIKATEAPVVPRGTTPSEFLGINSIPLPHLPLTTDTNALEMLLGSLQKLPKAANGDAFVSIKEG
jgi:hypothetical protein